ncbi:MAG TPA: uracil-DNA glycosylase family protein [Anaerolineae bacterium]|nr:uracil-DNA glycosylase family protein [Anaerolineae bacterium]
MVNRQVQLDALHAEIRSCRKCLDAGYPITPGGVFSGKVGARIMIVGQAPGVTEIRVLRPFNASSGKRLFQWLGAAGFDEADFRAQQYISSVTKCYPGKIRDGRGDRRPSREEQQLCRPYLDRTLAIIRPEVIILVGSLAIETLLGKYKLEHIIGHAFERPAPWDATKTVIFVPLPHPSGASVWNNSKENQQLIKKAIRQLARLKRELEL